MCVQEVMSTEVVAVGPEETANRAWTKMWRQRIRHLTVMDGERLVGLISERDLGGRDGSEVRNGMRVRDLMSEQVVSATPRTTLRQAANKMRGHTIGSLPVIEKDRVVGIVTATDVLDELGRSSTRPTVQAPRRDMRLPPASARQAALKRVKRNTARTRR